LYFFCFLWGGGGVDSLSEVKGVEGFGCNIWTIGNLHLVGKLSYLFECNILFTYRLKLTCPFNDKHDYTKWLMCYTKCKSQSNLQLLFEIFCMVNF
jgi:hypothetical protein